MKVPARVWREAFDGFLKTPDFTSELAKVSVPVLLMWGKDCDTDALRAAQDRLLKPCRTPSSSPTKECGHAFHWEGIRTSSPRILVPFLTSGPGPGSPAGRRGRLPGSPAPGGESRYSAK